MVLLINVTIRLYYFKLCDIDLMLIIDYTNTNFILIYV